MAAFAANSIFCRLALSDHSNDPVSFTILRLFAGAAILLPLALKAYHDKKIIVNRVALLPAFMLFSYALFFSLAYVQMTASTGALIVFPAAQMTMLGYSMYNGAKLSRFEKLGVIIALSGLVYLVLPGFDVPPVQASILMALSGISWGIYSILGKKAADPVTATAMNFIFTLPVVLALYLVFGLKLTTMGATWAVLSGALTSALGYLLWYIVMQSLKTSTAAVAMLSSPVIAAFGGILLLNEKTSLRLFIATALILGGLYIKIVANNKA
nr:DMT family transporter [Bdellovibrio bacteriovorus]